jgi:hypothetical protein
MSHLNTSLILDSVETNEIYSNDNNLIDDCLDTSSRTCDEYYHSSEESIYASIEKGEAIEAYSVGNF